MAHQIEGSQQSERRVLLVVDDEPMVRRLVVSAVAELDPEKVIEAEDGLHAQDVLRREPVDVVITDVKMPRMDGLELLHWGHERYPAAKWIVLSGLETFEAAVEALKSGAFDYLAKPPERNRVQVAVRNALDQIQLEAVRERLYTELEQKNARLAEQLEQLAGLCRMLEDQADVIDSDLERAAVIQHALLPQTPPRLDGWSLNTLYRPGTKVGGDFYDVVHLGVRYFGVIVADATGQGVAAAMLSVLLKHGLRFRDVEGVRSPAKVLTSANRLMCDGISAPGAFVTAAYALVDRRSGKVRIASAGHPPCIHLGPNGTTKPLRRTGPALGLSADASYDEVTVDLAEGDRLLLYTNGLLNREALETLITRIAENPDDNRPLRDLYGEASSNAKEDRDDGTLVLIERGDRPSQFDNEIIEDREPAEATRRAVPLLTSGTNEDRAFMQITGEATWMRSAIFYDTANELLSEYPNLSIDLSDCEYLDSTFLGTIHEIVTTHPDRVCLQRVPDNVVDLFDELSMRAVMDRTNINVVPLPTRMEPLKRAIKEEQEDQRLLKAHEVLAMLSDENEEQFRGVIAALRADVGGDRR